MNKGLVARVYTVCRQCKQPIQLARWRIKLGAKVMPDTGYMVMCYKCGAGYFDD